MSKYEHIRRFDVKYCDCDFKDELKPSALLAYLEEVACSSADELGFGYDYLKPKGYAFMVTNVRLEFLRPVRLGEKLVVKTWPTPPSYVVFGREYCVCVEKGEEEVLVNGTSRWCMADRNTGKLLQSKVLDNQDYSSYNTSRALNVNDWKIPEFSLADGELKFSLTVFNSEYDHNMHVNNTRYADYCFNCFSVPELAEKGLKGFAISYVKQCFEGETLRFYRKRAENDGSGELWYVRGVNEKDETVIRAEIFFSEK